MTRPSTPESTNRRLRRELKLAAANQRRREAGNARRVALVEDVQFLLDTGEWPSRIAHRVGAPNPAALAATMRRAGRQDLAYRVNPYTLAVAS